MPHFEQSKNKGTDMTLYESFAPHTSQEFPPKFVFCIFEGEPRSIFVKDIPSLESIYKCIGSVYFGNYMFPQLVGAN